MPWNLLLNKNTLLVGVFAFISWSIYGYHIDAIKDAIRTCDEAWKDRFSAAEEKNRRDHSTYLQTLADRTDDDLRREFKRLYPSAGIDTFCTGELQPDKSNGDRHGEVQADDYGFTGTREDYQVLQKENSIEINDTPVETCAYFNTIDERKACFKLLNDTLE